jgi:hypothetical protein
MFRRGGAVSVHSTRLPGVDAAADVALLGPGLSFPSRVESASRSVFVVRPSLGAFADRGLARVGEAAEIFWYSPEGRMGCPTRLTSVGEEPTARWVLDATGEIAPAQRRQAVRARVTLPVTVAQGDGVLAGDTVDLSEGGLRLVVEGPVPPPDPGTRTTVRLDLGGEAVVSAAEVIRLRAHDGRWVLSLRFVDLPERDGDQLRRRVFQALREERARQADR